MKLYVSDLWSVWRGEAWATKDAPCGSYGESLPNPVFTSQSEADAEAALRNKDLTKPLWRSVPLSDLMSEALSNWRDQARADY